MNSKQAELFKVLGVESRIRIIEILKQKGALGVNEISEILGITPSAVSQHLQILRHAGLVRSERKGYWIPYEIAPEALEECKELLFKVCTCGCGNSGQFRQAEIDKASDRLALLRKYEEELQKEIEKVRNQIAGVEDK